MDSDTAQGAVARPRRLPLPDRPAERASYLRRLARARAPNGAFLKASFVALDGSEQCSGLPVTRDDADALKSTFTTVVPDAANVETQSETQITPSGTTQPFTWTAGTITPPRDCEAKVASSVEAVDSRGRVLTDWPGAEIVDVPRT